MINDKLNALVLFFCQLCRKSLKWNLPIARKVWVRTSVLRFSGGIYPQSITLHSVPNAITAAFLFSREPCSGFHCHVSLKAIGQRNVYEDNFGLALRKYLLLPFVLPVKSQSLKCAVTRGGLETYLFRSLLVHLVQI